MSYRRRRFERGRAGGERFVARIKRTFEAITGDEPDYVDPRTGRPAKVRISERLAKELDELSEDLGIPVVPVVPEPGFRSRATRVVIPPEFEESRAAPPLGVLPGVTRPGFRSRATRAVIPPPFLGRTARPGFRSRVGPGVPTAPPLGPQPGLRARPRITVMPRTPYLIEEGNKGEVWYFERNTENFAATEEEYRTIADKIDIDTDYVMYVRRILDARVGESYLDNERAAPLRPNEIRSEGPTMWEGRPAELRWTKLKSLVGAKKKGGKTARGATITKERLYGLGKHWQENTKPYVYGRFVIFVPLGQAGKAWVKMREGEENCVVSAVRRALKEKRALTEKRAAVLDEAARQWGDRGADNAEVAWLSTRLKIRLPVYDLNESLLFEKTNKNGDPVYGKGENMTIPLYRSDGHCSSGNPGFAEAAKVEVYYPKEDEDPIKAAIELIKKKQIRRARIVGPEVLSDDSTLYRPEGMDRALHEYLAAERQRGPMADEQDYKLAFDREGQEYEEKDVLSLGGPSGYEWRKWLDQNGMRSLWEGESRRHWRQTCLEAVAWESEAGCKGSDHYDMRAAYLACDSSFGVGPAAEMAKRFGFPAGGKQRYAKANRIKDVEELAGAIRFSKFELDEGAHPFIKAQLRKHFEKSGWLTIPLAVWLEEHKAISCYEIDRVMYSVVKKERLRFPDNRDRAVRFVGRCAFSENKTTFFTRDEAERDHFIRVHGGTSAGVSDGHLVSFTDEKAKTNDYSYQRAYVLSYMAIAMMSACQFLGRCVRRCAVDAIFVEKGAGMTKVPTWDGVSPLKWGMFREKPWPESLCNAQRGEGGPVQYASPPSEIQDPPLPRKALTRQATAFISPAGSGKTYDAMRLCKKGDRCVVLAQNNAAVAALSTGEANPRGFPVYTYHQWTHTGHKGVEGWDPKTMGKAAFTDVVIWDEFAVAGVELLSKVLPWFNKMGIITILCGDPMGQLHEWEKPDSGEEVMRMIEEMKIPIEVHTTDWRAKDCPALQAAKEKAWCAPYETQVDALREIAYVTTRERMLETWRPGDIVIDPTKYGSACTAAALEEKRKAFPDAPVRFRFAPEDRAEFRKKGGVLPTVRAPNGALVPAIIGQQIEAKAGTACPENWVPDTASTVHSVQGATVKAPKKIFICVKRMEPEMWFKNGVYVAMSRAEKASQLVAVMD